MNSAKGKAKKSDLKLPKELANDLENIKKHDPHTYRMMVQFIDHVNSSYLERGKYTGSVLNTKGFIYGERELSMGYNMGQATRYIQRYCSQNDAKSYNPTDLMKCMHYTLFEAVRRHKLKEEGKDIIE